MTEGCDLLQIEIGTGKRERMRSTIYVCAQWIQDDVIWRQVVHFLLL